MTFAFVITGLDPVIHWSVSGEALLDPRNKSGGDEGRNVILRLDRRTQYPPTLRFNSPPVATGSPDQVG